MLERASMVLGGIALSVLGVVVVGFGGLHLGFSLDAPPMAALFSLVVFWGLALCAVGVRVFSANVPLHWERGSATVPVLRRGRN
jgi:hypothetical protein